MFNVLKCESSKVLFFRFVPQLLPKMSVFTQKLNPITGINDWVVQQEDYDYHQEVARSSFADMLHDTERNQMYETALKSAIASMHAGGRPANVLDIGTGTGLLSMMAARNGADSVTACEAFKPMSECALKIIKRNGFDTKIRIIPKRSTELTVGPGADLETKCNILVTEVFDTELIGEGALSTFKHAHEVLLERNCVVVPQSATVYAQVVECPLAQNWNKIKHMYDIDGEGLIRIPDNVTNCAGSPAVHDLQLNQFDSKLIKTIVEPIPVFRFDWSGQTPFVFDRSTINSVKAVNTGTAQVVFMWWELQMDIEARVVLSCAPYWAHPLSRGDQNVKLPWRDHWMQAVYYLPCEINVRQGAEVNLISCHDEYSLWFSVRTDLRLGQIDYLKPICECGLHMAFSRTRIGQINDGTRNKKYLKILEENVDGDSTILVLSDGFYLSLAAAKLGAKMVYYIETNYLSRKILVDFIRFNGIENVEVFENLDILQARDVKNINVVLGEPYFINSILPWDNLMFVYLLKGVKHLLTDDVKIFPKTATVRAVAVNFDDLHKIRIPLGKCEGFDMKDFDDLIEASSNVSDDNVEAQPLWEYPGTALSEVVQVISIDSDKIPENVVETSGIFKLGKGLGDCNGIALWVDWLHGSTVVSTGPTTTPEIGQRLQWDMHTRQAVTLFSGKEVDCLGYAFKFDFQEGNISFKCS